MIKERNISLNLNIRGLNQSQTLAINELSKSLQAKGKKIYAMGLGQSPFPVPEHIVDSLKLHASEKDYLPVKGLKSLRQAIAHFHQQNDYVDIKAKNILVGPGSKELMFILLLVYYGDVLLASPSWVSYAPQAQIIGRNIKTIKTSVENKWRITPKQLDDFLSKEKDQYKPRLLILNYPSNPVGGTYSVDELKKIAKIARKYELIILSDEIYGRIHFKGQHTSIARFYPEGTIISSGLSKWCGAGGWRLGTFAFPSGFEWLIDAMATVASETFTSVSAPIQYAAIKAFKGGRLIENYLFHSRRVLAHLAKKSYEILKNGDICLAEPEGGFYLFLDFTKHKDKLNKAGIIDSNEMCTSLLKEKGVAILPGEAFQRSAEELTARLAFVNFDGSRALIMSKTIPMDQELPEDFADLYCPMVIEGMEKIVEWLNSKI